MPLPTLGSLYLFPKDRNLRNIVSYYKRCSQTADTRSYPDLIPKVHQVRLKKLGGPGCGWGGNMSVVVGRRQVQARNRKRT